MFINESLVETIQGFVTFGLSGLVFFVSEMYSNWLFRTLEIKQEDSRMNSSFIVFKHHKQKCNAE